VSSDSGGTFRSRLLWVATGWAVVLGFAAGFGGLIFLGAVDALTELVWPDEGDVESFFGGEPWWILLMAAFGAAVGVTRRLLSVPEKLPGIMDEIGDAEVDVAMAPKVVAVSAVSLVSGASLGPEQPVGAIGGGFAGWLAGRRGHSQELAQINALSAISAVFGGILTAPFLSSILVMEGRIPVMLGSREAQVSYWTVLLPSIIASSIGFTIFVAIGGQALLDVYRLPSYEFEVWHMGIGVLLGVVGAALSLLVVISARVIARLTASMRSQPILKATMGGAVLGVLAFALPLTLFSGAEQLGIVINDSAKLGASLIIATMLGKMLAMTVSLGTGFVGGTIFPSLFIGGAAGVGIFELGVDLPEALVVSCLLAAVPAAMVGLPFTFIIIAVLTVGIGGAQAAPAGLAVVTAYLCMTGVRLFIDYETKPHETKNIAVPTPAGPAGQAVPKS
jgi:H+/Cl- antiporter ClcA